MNRISSALEGAGTCRGRVRERSHACIVSQRVAAASAHSDAAGTCFAADVDELDKPRGVRRWGLQVDDSWMGPQEASTGRS